MGFPHENTGLPMKNKVELPIEQRFRKVHLDFHTPAWVEGVGSDFNADEFVRTLIEAKVDNICIFGKCCHGLSYYDTEIGVRHPHLKYDLLRKMIDALRSAGIAVSIYYSIVWDDLIVDRHPEWAQRDKLGNPRFGFGKLWRTVCVNSPYTDGILLPQVKELVQRYIPDELWFDMLWVVEEECFCNYCREVMISLDLDPESRTDRIAFSDWTDEHFVEKVSEYIKTLNPDVRVTYNNCVRVGARHKIPSMDVFEIESLPHAWGYWYFPLYSRHIRTHGIPVKGMTCRFHKFWGDFGSLKPIPQLQFEAASMIAQGAGCVIGDQLDPGGKLEGPAYRNIGEMFDFIEKRENWSREWKPVVDIGLLADDEPGSISQGKPSPNLLGALKILMETHCQFDIIDCEADLTKYALVIVADTVIPTQELLEKLETYLVNGGKLIFTGKSLSSAPNDWRMRFLGTRYNGMSEYSQEYIRVTDEQMSRNVPSIDLIAYDRFSVVDPIDGVEILGRAVQPLAERTPIRYMSHLQASPGTVGPYPSIIRFIDRVIYFAPAIFKSYFESGNTVFRHLLDNAIEMLLPQTSVRTNAPSSAEVTLLRSSESYAVHVVNYSPSRRGNHPEVLDEIRSLHDISISVRIPDTPKRVYIFPGEKELSYRSENGYIQVIVPEVEIHAGVCFEY
jgi:hypothetical protein